MQKLNYRLRTQINMLRLLPQHDRLARPALVCKSWAAAATAATTDVVLAKTTTAVAATGMCSWVQQHGRGAVESIQVLKQGNGLCDTALQLTLPSAALAKLAKLPLTNCALEFDSAELGGSAVVLPALRLLSLNSCTVPQDTLSVLQCPQLTGLQLLYHPLRASTLAINQERLDAALSAFLQRLPGLVFLSLGHPLASDAALAQLSCLQQLQDCTLRCPCVTTVVLANLTSSITSLTLTQGMGVLQEGSLPAAVLPHLKELSVSQRVMQPALLSRLTKLERLTLSTCELRTDPDAADSNDSNAGGAQLLATLAQLTNLKKLGLTNIMLDPPETFESVPQPGGAAAHQLRPFSALTASSQLESLTLAYKKAREPLHEDDHGQVIHPFARGAAVWMFPPGRQLTALTELVLDAVDPKLVEKLRDDSFYTVDRDPFNRTCMSGSDLSLLLAACPKLQRLGLNAVLPHSCSELYDFLKDPQGQPHLSYLCLGGLCLTDSAAFALAGITRLRDLELHNSPLLTPEGVAQLVKLRQLSRLKVDGIGACRSIICCLTSDSQTDQPNVWQKLERKMSWMREHHRYWQKFGSAVYKYPDTSDSDSDW